MNSKKRYESQIDHRLREAHKYGDEMKQQWLKEHKKVSAIAKLHMPRVSPFGHPVDLPRTLLGNASRSAKTILWCNGCNVAWPCKPTSSRVIVRHSRSSSSRPRRPPMSDRITGAQARELLNGTTPGPWHEEDREAGGCAVFSDGHGPVAFVSNRIGGDPGEVPSEVDGRLLAAAPDLATSVAWLYGREPEEHEPPEMVHHTNRYKVLTIPGANGIAMYEGNFIGISDEMTVDEAVDLARALLAAAEEARDA